MPDVSAPFASFFTEVPEWLSLPLADWVTAALEWLVVNGETVFDAVSGVLRWGLAHLEGFLVWLPWTVVVALFALGAWRLGSGKLGLGVGTGMVFIASLDMWELAMATMALVLAATILSVAAGIPIGIASARYDRLYYALVRPVVDMAQTMPSFVYLVPALMLFGLGRVPALVATIAYAMPPVIRLTSLGIRQVSVETVEAALAFGATPRQLLGKVQLPLAWPTIMAGVNQTIMMALSMVVIASMIGAGGLGREVLEGLSRLDVGKAFVGGISITVLAIIIDRLSVQAARTRRERAAGHPELFGPGSVASTPTSPPPESPEAGQSSVPAGRATTEEVSSDV
jgi:glycine betaine/proline transport system permease protein